MTAEYMATAPDAVAEFSAPILQHMNADHSETTRAMIKHYVTGVEVMNTASMMLFMSSFDGPVAVNVVGIVVAVVVVACSQLAPAQLTHPPSNFRPHVSCIHLWIQPMRSYSLALAHPGGWYIQTH